MQAVIILTFYKQEIVCLGLLRIIGVISIIRNIKKLVGYLGAI